MPIDRFRGDDFDGVGTENYLATQRMTAHLLEHGHQHIAYIKGKSKVSTTK